LTQKTACKRLIFNYFKELLIRFYGTAMMEKYCFIIQPFEGVYDKRFEDIYRIAIEKTGLKAYRVDKDSSVKIIISEIEKKIRGSELCFADISEDKPNVWYELGYATANGKDVILVCDKKKRERLPFDINQRSVIFYNTGAPSDFSLLEAQIIEKIEAYIKSRKNIDTLSETPISDARGLSPYELALLAFLVAEMEGATYGLLSQRMENAGFNDVATSIGLRLLVKKGFVLTKEEMDEYNGNTYNLYVLTKDGEDFVLNNTHLFEMNTKKESDDILPF
jgi:hypothetical protein